MFSWHVCVAMTPDHILTCTMYLTNCKVPAARCLMSCLVMGSSKPRNQGDIAPCLRMPKGMHEPWGCNGSEQDSNIQEPITPYLLHHVLSSCTSHCSDSVPAMLCRHRRATVVQSWVRMWLVRTRFRRNTAAGKKAAARAARNARIQAAAIVLQKYVRRYLARKKVNNSHYDTMLRLMLLIDMQKVSAAESQAGCQR